MKGLQALQEETRTIVKAGEEAALQEFTDAGGTVYRLTPEQRQTFVTATAGMRDWFSAQYGDEWLLHLDQAVNTCTAS